MRANRLLLVALLILAASAGAEPTATSETPPTAASNVPPPTAPSEVKPAPLAVAITVSLEPKDAKRAVVVQGTTNLPDRTIIECHLYVTYGVVDGQERSTFVDGCSAVADKGKFTAHMGPYVMALGTYRVESIVDSQRQYPDVRKALQTAGTAQIHAQAEFKTGTDEEISEEREVGRPRMLHGAERVLALSTELLNHSQDLKGPLEKGDWEAPWLERAQSLKHRLVPVPGAVVGQNQMSRPLSEQYDKTETTLLDCIRAMLKAYQTLANVPDKAQKKPEEGEIPPWPEAVTAPGLQSLIASALDTLASDYQQDLFIRLEGILRNARALHQQASSDDGKVDPRDPDRPKPKDLWVKQAPHWVADCKALKEELSLLTDENSPRLFIKQVAKRLLPARDRLDALATEVESVVQGLGRALASGKPPGDEVAQAIDRFYAGYAQSLLTQMGGAHE